MIRKEPELISSFLPEMLEFQADRSPVVRRYLLDFLSAVIENVPTISTVLDGIRCVRSLLNDEGAATVKRALACAYHAFRASLVLVAIEENKDSEQLTDLWKEALELKSTAASILMASDSAEGLKIASCRFVEQSAMLLTADLVPQLHKLTSAPMPFPSGNMVVAKADLMREGEGLIANIASFIKSAMEKEGNEELSLQVVCAVVRAASVIIQQRPQFAGRLLPQLLSIAKSGKFKSHEKDERVHTILTTSLRNTLKSQHPMLTTWRNKVEAGLLALGEGTGIRDESTDLEIEKRAPKRMKMGMDQTVSDTVGGASHTQKDRSLPVANGSVTEPQLLQQTDSVIKGLISAKDAATLAPFILALQPELMADLVLAYLRNLPPRGALPADDAPYEPWLEKFCEKFQIVGGFEEDVTQDELEIEQTKVHDSNHVDPQRKEGYKDSEEEEEDSVASRTHEDLETALQQEHGNHLGKGNNAAFIFPVDVLEPNEMTENQKSNMRRDAVSRILKTEKTSAPLLRCALIGRLATMAADEDEVASEVIDYLMSDFYKRSGFQIVDRWLLSLFAEHVDGFDETGISFAESLVGSRYENVILSVLEAVRDKLPTSDSALKTILLEAPALPMPSVKDFLKELCAAGSDSATQALVVVRDLTLARPPNRDDLLEVAFEASISDSQDLRTKAVKLLVNRLFTESVLTVSVENFAKQQLSRLQRKEEQTRMTEIDALRYCTLFCALCTKKNILLKELFETFAESSTEGKAAIVQNAPGLAKTLGPRNPELLQVVEKPPEGSLELALEMINVLTESMAPPAPLVNSVLKLFEASKDPRLLPAILPGAPKAVALKFIPSLIALPSAELKRAFGRLVAPLPDSSDVPAIFAPVELLTALHTLDTGKDGQLLRHAMAAITTCINSPDLFPPETLAASINQLLTRVPLPQLFMRTVLQSFNAAPRLRSFIVGVLGQLIGKQVWNDKTQWRGWIMAAQQTTPDSFPVWLQLPAKSLEDALQNVPQEHRAQLAAYALSPDCKVSYPSATKAVVLQFSGRSTS